MLPAIFGENLFDDLFDDNFERDFFGQHNPLYGKHEKNLMKTDVKETEGGYELAVDLPGFKKDEVNVELQDGYLTISASKNVNRDEKDKKGRYIRQERYTGACSRSFYVGDLKNSDVNAKYEDGILRLSIPKKDVRQLPGSNKIAIE